MFIPLRHVRAINGFHVVQSNTTRGTFKVGVAWSVPLFLPVPGRSPGPDTIGLASPALQLGGGGSRDDIRWYSTDSPPLSFTQPETKADRVSVCDVKLCLSILAS